MEKRTNNYWQEIRPVWWAEIKSWFGWGNWKQTVTSIIIVIGSIIFLIVGGEFDLANEEISVRVATILIGVFWLFVVIIISFVSANNILHKEQIKNQKSQNRIINTLAKKGNKEEGTVKANVRFEVFPKQAGKYACIKIFNNEAVDLTNCYVVLKKVSITQSAFMVNMVNKESTEQVITRDALDSINPNNNFISWAGGGDKNGYKNIEGNNYAVLNVAEILGEGGDWWFAFLFNNGETGRIRKVHPKGDYKLTISLRGFLNGKPIEPAEYSFLMGLNVFKRGDKKLKKIMEKFIKEQNTFFGIVDKSGYDVLFNMQEINP